jgi:hypothetical protein
MWLLLLLRRSCAVVVALFPVLLAAGPARAQHVPITFSAIADIPYGVSERPLLQQHVADHNLYSPSEFLVHLGDLVFGECLEDRYIEVADVLKGLAVPVFVTPGDNEWNDCDDPDLAWSYWARHFLRFEDNFCGTPPVEIQAVRPENFAFVRKGVLFVGVNLVGGRVSDGAEWDLRLLEDADWVDQQLREKRPQVRAAVVFAQAGPGDSNRTLFFDLFAAAAGRFGKPVLFLHGDGHTWIHDRPFAAGNVLRVQLDRGVRPPVQVTVTLDAVNPFQFDRAPFDGTPIDQPPCVEAGPDLSIDLLEAARLEGRASDDGDPPGIFSTAWSKVQGPGSVTFEEGDSPANTATFSDAGVYRLRLSAYDGERSTSDDVEVEVLSDEPRLTIDDLFVDEGDSALFTVTLASPDGSAVEVDYDTRPGTATESEDYEPVEGRLSFSGSTTEQTVAVPVVQDRLPEPAESFTVNLSSADALLFKSQGAGVILDDDTVYYLLTVDSEGAGDVSLAPPGPLYEDGTLVTLEAHPDTVDTLFRGWGGDLAGLENPSSILMDSSKRVSASFETVAGLGVNFREVAAGSSSLSEVVETSSGLSAVEGQLYLAAIATHPYVDVVEVSGLGLAWSPAYSQCSGRNRTGVSVWQAQGTPSGDGPVSALLSGAPDNAVLTLSRYSGVLEVDPIGNLVSGNTNGVAGACVGGTDSDRYALPLTTLETGSVVYAAVAMRSRAHTPGSQYDERVELRRGSGGATASLAVADGAFGFPGTVFVDGRLSGDVDWALVALEIRRAAEPARTATLTVRTEGGGSVSPSGGSYDAGALLLLTATPDPGFAFTSWEGDLTGAANPATLTLDRDKSVTAVFLAPEPPAPILAVASLLGVALTASRRARYTKRASHSHRGTWKPAALRWPPPP